ncbi:MAG: ABC transporter permease [Bacteroidaceae bacterium]|nr:ABC transporter permease [Bacteroidaceae bacterium]
MIWKLLRQHISVSQFVGFFTANLVGMLIVLISIQFYRDVIPVFTEDDGLISRTYLILSKKITAVSSLMGEANTFSENDIEDIRAQRFTRKVGVFTASQYKVYASLGVGGLSFGTDMFFESVPSDFVDTDASSWHFNPSGREVPIILPRSYLAIYNFGFAQSQSLPRLTEGVVGMIPMDIRLSGNGQEERLKGRVIGFSSRLNTILVPEDFMEWSNSRLAPDSDTAPTRLIIEVTNPTDHDIARYIGERGYEMENDQLEAGRLTYFLKIVTGIVLAIGLLISILSFYILMLSVYLLLQKNTTKLENLLLIGYSPARVSRPYQLLTVAMNLLVLVIAIALLLWIRSQYMNLLWSMFPQIQEASLFTSVMSGCAIFTLVSIFNIIAIRRRVNAIWRHKE